MAVATDNPSHLTSSQVLGYHPAVVLPCALLLLGITYYIGFLLYNVTLHPLASFPGPKLYAASSLFFSRMVLRGTLPMDVRKLHEQYGDVVRISPDQISFIDPEAWKEVYGVHPGQPQRPKDQRHVSVGPNSTPSLLRTDDYNHSRYRRSLVHGFSEGSLQKQEPIVKGYIDLLIQRLREQIKTGHGSAHVDMVRWYNFTTFDIIGDLAFGESFGCLDNSEYHFWVAVIFSHFRTAAWASFFRRVPMGQWLMKLIVPNKVQNEKKTQNQLTEAKVQSRIQKGSDRPDFLSNVLKHDGTEKGMTIDELVSNSYVLIIAGSETTATLLSGVTYYILTVPGVFDKLKAEIRNSFSSEEEISWSAVNQLRCTLAVLNEGLRMYPPVPFGFPRMVEGEGAFICGKWVPGGTSVGISILPSQRAPSNFIPTPSFQRDSWVIPNLSLTRDTPFSLSVWDHGIALAASMFSVAICSQVDWGLLTTLNSLAYAEMRLILARMIWNFDMELAPESQGWIDQLSFVVWDKPPLKVKLTQAARI